MDTKKRVCLKALDLFVREGYDNTPMSLIAKELGLSKAGLCHHYLNKESLLFDVIEYPIEKNFIPIFDEAEKIPDPEKRLAYFLRSFTKMIAKDGASSIAVHEARRLKPYQSLSKNFSTLYKRIRGRDALILCGGMANTQRVLDLLRESLPAEPHLFAPDPSYMAAVGAALSAM